MFSIKRNPQDKFQEGLIHNKRDKHYILKAALTLST